MSKKKIQALLAFQTQTPLGKGLKSLDLELTELPVGDNRRLDDHPDENFDLLILLVDARIGISASMIELWYHFAERQLPRLVLVQGMEFAESDFDDIVLIGNRVLELLATPYLLLHDELGLPTGLISLEDDCVYDYSGSEVRKYLADQDLRELISEFKTEYLDNFQELGLSGFISGVYAIALPIGSDKKFGFAEANEIIRALPKPQLIRL